MEGGGVREVSPESMKTGKAHWVPPSVRGWTSSGIGRKRLDLLLAHSPAEDESMRVFRP